MPNYRIPFGSPVRLITSPGSFVRINASFSDHITPVKASVRDLLSIHETWGTADATVRRQAADSCYAAAALIRQWQQEPRR